MTWPFFWLYMEKNVDEKLHVYVFFFLHQINDTEIGENEETSIDMINIISLFSKRREVRVNELPLKQCRENSN